MELKTGDILHCKRKSLLSKLIKFFTQSEYTHTAIVVVLEKEICVVEMQNKGCEIKTFDNWKRKYNYEYVVSYSSVRPPSARKIMSKSGVMGYDFELFIIKYPIRLILGRILGREFKVKRSENEDEKMICSEFVAWCYGWGDTQSFTPKKVYEKCFSESWAFRKN